MNIYAIFLYDVVYLLFENIFFYSLSFQIIRGYYSVKP